MYSKIAEEVDNKMAERYQREGDATLIFVSPMFPSFWLLTSTGIHRVVYSQPQSLHHSQCRFKT